MNLVHVLQLSLALSFYNLYKKYILSNNQNLVFERIIKLQL